MIGRYSRMSEVEKTFNYPTHDNQWSPPSLLLLLLLLLLLQLSYSPFLVWVDHKTRHRNELNAD